MEEENCGEESGALENLDPACPTCEAKWLTKMPDLQGIDLCLPTCPPPTTIFTLWVEKKNKGQRRRGKANAEPEH